MALDKFDRSLTGRARNRALVFAALAIGLAGSPAWAAIPTIANGDFETVKSGATTSYQLSASSTTTLPGWTTSSSGIDCLIYNTGPTYTMCGPGYSSPTQSSNVTFGAFPGYSPVGGNFLGSDSSVAYEQAISQTVNNLVVGQKYAITFYQAGAQQQGYVGATTDVWQVTFGTSTQTSSVMTVPEQGDFPWQQQKMIFTATNQSQLLTFLAIGTPNTANPPFALLDGVTIAAPEPASLSLFGLGLAGVAVLRRRRARRAA